MRNKSKIEEIYNKGVNEKLRDEYRRLMDHPEHFELNESIYTLWLEQKVDSLQEMWLCAIKWKKDLRAKNMELKSKFQKLEAAFIKHGPPDIVREFLMSLK